jgi:hypothetical protein
MADFDDESGVFIPPHKTYLDEIEIFDPDLGGVVPAWKALIYHGAKARAQIHHRIRADSAGPAIGQDKAPPLVADADEEEDRASLIAQIRESLDSLNRRMDQLEARQQLAAETARAEEALDLAEKIAAPGHHPKPSVKSRLSTNSRAEQIKSYPTQTGWLSDSCRITAD